VCLLQVKANAGGPDGPAGVRPRQRILPQLWLHEVGNTIARRFPAHASAWLTALMKFGLTEAVPSQVWLAAALELTRTYAVSFYDAAYHALAITSRGVFVTADVRYANRMARDRAVVALSDWKPPVDVSRPRGRSPQVVRLGSNSRRL
jgi:hypothetical protein